MADPEREQLRRLAVWLACRRDVDEAIGQLTRYGPAANDRVAVHLSALRDLLALERDAFESVAVGADERPQRPLPPHEPLGSTVHSMQHARDRRENA